MKATQITRDQMVEAISRSGYLMEQRVFPKIEYEGFYVETNPVYADPVTGKSREYDFSALTAEKLFRGEFGFLFTALVGECVNNTQPLVFFTASAPLDFLFHKDIKCAGIPLYFPKMGQSGDDISIQEFLHFEKFHHYCKGRRYSTQYCSFRPKKSKGTEWLAWHEEEHHGLFESLVEATRFEVQKAYSNWRLPGKAEKEPVNMTLFYPLLIVGGDLYECRQTKSQALLTKRRHIQFRKSVISGSSQETYHIDVITESYLPRYLTMISTETEEMKKRFQRNKKEVQKAIDHIVNLARTARVRGKLSGFISVLDFRGRT